MPQLEQIYTYASQVFWLVVTFGLLYLVLWRSALPKVADLLHERQERIDGDLERAERLKEEAETVLKSYEATIAEARAEAHAALRDAADRIARQSEERHTALGQKLAKDTGDAEARIARAREEALSNIRAVSAEVAQAATARLVGLDVSEGDAEAAVDDAMKGRA